MSGRVPANPGRGRAPWDGADDDILASPERYREEPVHGSGALRGCGRAVHTRLRRRARALAGGHQAVAAGDGPPAEAAHEPPPDDDESRGAAHGADAAAGDLQEEQVAAL